VYFRQSLSTALYGKGICFVYFFDWTLQKVDNENWKVLKYDTGEGWRRLFELIV